jgi:predicted nucleic acid-binding Zn ribbon protein
MIAPLVSFGHCIVCSLSIYWFWLPLWYLLGIVLNGQKNTKGAIRISNSTKNKQWPKDIKGAIRISKSTKNRQYNGQKKTKGQSESVNRRRTNNGQKKPKGKSESVLGHCIVCSSSIYWFWLPLWDIWPLFCLFFVDLPILVAALVSFGHCIVCSSAAIRISKSTKNRQYNGQRIPKGQAESENRGITDNTMAKRNQRGNQNQ